VYHYHLNFDDEYDVEQRRHSSVVRLQWAPLVLDGLVRIVTELHHEIQRLSYAWQRRW
jgi:hypothetical protein